jgi:hypothetical protein
MDESSKWTENVCARHYDTAIIEGARPVTSQMRAAALEKGTASQWPNRGLRRIGIATQDTS